MTGALAIFVYDYLEWKWVAVPWLPISLIGTATAFFVGFKNNQAYDRNWEARQIWGNITNISRAFSAASRAFINNDFASIKTPENEIEGEVKTLLYRHIGWLYTMKRAMQQRTTWEHHDKASERQRRALKLHIDNYKEEIREFLAPEEIEWLATKKNGATQLLDRQSQHLLELKRKGLLDDFRHIELQKMITDLYNEQGKSERIKNTPFPRQYATISTIFIVIFTILLPFGMIGEFEKLGHAFIWLLLPFNSLVAWVFLLMEYTGDVSENPFEGLLNDVPVRTIVRNIEIDIKDMLAENELPERVKPLLGSIH
jgi:putative membrane protein